MTIHRLRERILKERPDLDWALLDKAIAFAERAHAGRLRYSGEPAFSHPVAVAEILLDLNPDLLTLQLALLHDVLEDTAVTAKELEAEFGPELRHLAEGFAKLSVIKVPGQASLDAKWNLLFLAMASDLRLIFVKLADRLHNMRTLDFVPAAKQKRIAKESLMLHAPIASRLGLYQMKSELEDLSFRILYPEEWEKLAEKLFAIKGRSEAHMRFARGEIQALLLREGVDFLDVQGRLKHLWSIQQKMQKKEVETLEDIYDLFALRVILPDQISEGKESFAHLYTVLGLLHGEYLPLQDRFKDYVAVPKPNRYRSLHSTILGLGGGLYSGPTEVQIRTESMHKEAEMGVASHWIYKEGKKGHKTSKPSFLGKESVSLDFYPDRIFVLTPGRDIIELRRGSTPLDFAYAIHSDVGNQTAFAKVNGRIVPLDHELKNGDLVEIGTRGNVKPKRLWLAIVKSSQAKQKIKNWFYREEEKEKESKRGSETMGKEVVHGAHKPGQAKPIPYEDLDGLDLLHEVLVTGEDDLPVIFSACCKPKPPEPVIGYVTRGQSIRIHKQSCRELGGLEGERFVSAHWKPKSRS